MRPRIASFAAAVLFTASPALAEQYWGKTRINSVAAVTEDRLYPQYSNVIFVGVSNNAWLPARCRKMPGLLMRDKEQAMFALAQSAMESGRKVVLKADDEAMIGEYCTVFQITAYSR